MTRPDYYRPPSHGDRLLIGAVFAAIVLLYDAVCWLFGW